MREPIHPSELIRDIMENRKINEYQLAELCKVEVEYIFMMLKGTNDLTEKDAMALAQGFNTSKEFWLGLQEGFEKDSRMLPFYSEIKEIDKDLIFSSNPNSIILQIVDLLKQYWDNEGGNIDLVLDDQGNPKEMTIILEFNQEHGRYNRRLIEYFTNYSCVSYAYWDEVKRDYWHYTFNPKPKPIYY